MCVLIAEDEWLILSDLAASFENAGYDVLTASDGQSAVDLITSRPNHFTMLVSDLHMPGGLSGSELIEFTRAGYPDIPIVLTSAMSNAVSDRWRQAHSVDVVPKPYVTEELVTLAKHLLAG